MLDDIDGIGPKRRKALLETFESVEEIKRIAMGTAADADGGDPVETLMRAESVDRKSAENVVKFFSSRKM